MISLLPSQSTWIIGHRGAAGEALENTLDSFWLAIRQGADMIELDVQLTRDNQLIAFHDWDLERLAGDRSVVEESRLGDLQEIGIREAAQSEDARLASIPSLQEILAELPRMVPLNVELKRRTADPMEMATELERLLRNRSQVLVSSFDWELLAEVRKLHPDCPVAPIAREDSPALLEAAGRLGAFSIHCSRRIVDRKLIAAARLQNRPLLVYTVNHVEEARSLFERGVGGVFSDFPGRMLQDLEA